MQWDYFGKGNFNYVFVNSDKSKVLKVQQPLLSNLDLLLDVPERSVRIWNDINTHLPVKAELLDAKDLQLPTGKILLSSPAWSAPYIEGRDATQQEVCTALIDIYNRCGRVVLDAMVKGNFKAVDTDGSTKVVCVDIGMSLRLQKKEESLMEESFASLEVWSKVARDTYLPWFRRYENDKSSICSPTNMSIYYKCRFSQRSK